MRLLGYKNRAYNVITEVTNGNNQKKVAKEFHLVIDKRIGIAPNHVRSKGVKRKELKYVAKNRIQSIR